jgi:ABC-type nitrate/sulfonate/bicarbonate transport system substrate-binding protein
VRLIAAGNSAAEAERWASQTLAWQEANPEALTVFARASVRMWDQIAEHGPVEWKATVAASARSWLEYR